MAEDGWDEYRAEVAAADRSQPVSPWALQTLRFWVIAAVVAVTVIAAIAAWLLVFGDVRLSLLTPLGVVVAGMIAVAATPQHAGAIALGQATGLLVSIYTVFQLAAAGTPGGDNYYAFVGGITVMAIPAALVMDLLVWGVAKWRRHPRLTRQASA